MTMQKFALLTKEELTISNVEAQLTMWQAEGKRHPADSREQKLAIRQAQEFSKCLTKLKRDQQQATRLAEKLSAKAKADEASLFPGAFVVYYGDEDGANGEIGIKKCVPSKDTEEGFFTKTLCDFSIQVLSRKMSLEDPSESSYELELVAHGPNGIPRRKVIVPKSDKAQSLAEFKKLSGADFPFIGTEADFLEIWRQIIVRSEVPDTWSTEVLGFHHHPITKVKTWIGPTQTFKGEGAELSESKDLTHNLPTDTLTKYPSHFTPTEKLTDTQRNLLSEHLFTWNDIKITHAFVGWFAANFFKTELTKVLPAWPILYPRGESGAGKTTSVQMTAKMYGVLSGEKDFTNSMINFMNTTAYSIRKYSGQSNTLPLILDEVKPKPHQERKKSDWLEIVNAAYNMQGASRGSADGSVKTMLYHSPIIAFGEKTVGDRSTMDRVIPVDFVKNDRSEYGAAWEQYQKLPLHVLGNELFALTMSPQYCEELVEKFKLFLKMYKPGMRDRQVSSAAVVACGLYAVYQVLQQEMSDADLFELATLCFEDDNAEENGVASAVDEILEVIDTLLTTPSRHFIENVHWRKITSKTNEECIAIKSTLLWTAVNEFFRGQDRSPTIDNKEDFVKQLRPHARFVENNKGVRFPKLNAELEPDLTDGSTVLVKSLIIKCRDVETSSIHDKEPLDDMEINGISNIRKLTKRA